MPTKTLYIFRHGQTDWNKEQRMQGSTAWVPLNDVGLEQAKKSAEILSAVGLEVIYASPLKRAAQTADIVAARLGVNVVSHAGLVERSFGDLEALTRPEMIAKFADAEPEVHAILDRNHPLFKTTAACGVESIVALEKRMCAAVRDVVAQAEEVTIGIATHGAAIFSFLVGVLGHPNFDPLENCEIVKVEWSTDTEKFKLIQRRFGWE